MYEYERVPSYWQLSDTAGIEYRKLLVVFVVASIIKTKTTIKKQTRTQMHANKRQQAVAIVRTTKMCAIIITIIVVVVAGIIPAVLYVMTFKRHTFLLLFLLICTPATLPTLLYCYLCLSMRACAFVCVHL